MPLTSSSVNYVDRVLALSNIERREHGLVPLTFDSQLSSAAQRHSSHMARDDFFAHTGSDGDPFSRIRATGYQYSSAAENIAAGQQAPEAVVTAWMNSPGHRANILNPNYTEIGIGYFYLQNDTGNVNNHSYWTQTFADPLSSSSSQGIKRVGTTGNDTLTGSNENDRLVGYRGDDHLLGRAGHDRLLGRGGDDHLNGYGVSGTEYDTLSGGLGNDTFVLGGSWGVSYLGNGYATITDWNSSDYIEARGNSVRHTYGSSAYTLDYSQDWGGASAVDTAIYYGLDLIAVVEDTTAVSFSNFHWV